MGTLMAQGGGGFDYQKQNSAGGQLRAPSRTAALLTHLLLVVIGTSALITCVSITWKIANVQKKALEWNKVWTNRTNMLVALRSAVANLGIAADASQETNTPEQRKRSDAAVLDLDTKLSDIRTEMTSSGDVLDPSMDEFLNARLNKFIQASAVIRSAVDAAPESTQLSATDIDAQEKLANNAITETTTFIRSQQVSRAEQSLVAARFWIRWQYIVGGITIPFMFALAALSVRTSRRLRRSLEDRQRALSELNAYQAALDNHAIITVTDAKGSITHLNDAFSRICKYSRNELVGQNHRILNSGVHPPEFWTDMWHAISAGIVWHGEACNRAKDGSLFWVAVTVLPLAEGGGRPHSFISIATDITRQKLLEEELRIAARTDKLTGLANRAVLSDHIHHAIARARRHPEYYFAVLFLDMDRFKLIDDCLGHEAGDLLLCEIAKRLDSTLREEDLVAIATVSSDSHAGDKKRGEAVRLGGDEFVVLLDGLQSPSDACIVAERLLSKLAEPFPILATVVHSTASIGIVTSELTSTSVADVLRDADTAMYEAKLAGKGRYVVFDRNMRERVERRVHLETALRTAMEGGQLMLSYQPIVCLKTGTIFSYEALLRWKHPEFGMISPAEFIPIAEDSGLIIPIGEWVLRESCRQLMQWRKAMPANIAQFPGISVNVSRNQLAVCDLPATVRQVLSEFKLEPSSLHLEITEGVVMRDPVSAGRVLRSLKEIGVKLALDDFGTGYSSLSSVHEFPLDVIKVDRSFIVNMVRGRNFAALVQAIISLTRNLGIHVVAEGIETTDQLNMLQSIGCQYGQGYLFAKPLRAEDVPTLSLNLPSKAA